MVPKVSLTFPVSFSFSGSGEIMSVLSTFLRSVD